MLEKIIAKLDRYRQENDLWSELVWNRDESIENYIDKNEGKRTEILIALQFNRKEKDEELIRFLMTEEIKDRSNDPFQGGSENLNRAGYLLASYRNPLNVEFFLKAKVANFDTHCGFDWEHILSAGVEKTFNQIEKSPEEFREIFHSYFDTLENCGLSEQDIENWLNRKANEWYPNNPDQLNEEDWIDLAFNLNELTIAKGLVDEFEKKASENKDSLLSLKYYRGMLNDLKAQIKIATKLLEFPKDEDLRSYDFIEISQLHLKLNEINESWSSISRAIKMRHKLDKGRLGQIADICIKIVNQSKKEYSFLPECYEFGVRNLGHFQALNQAKEKLAAAVKMKDSEMVEYFELIVEKEQAKMDLLTEQIEKGKNND